jgi:hypothetical protein
MGGDCSQKLLPWKGLSLLSGAQPLPLSGVLLSTSKIGSESRSSFPGLSAVGSLIAAIEEWRRGPVGATKVVPGLTAINKSVELPVTEPAVLP